MWASAASFGLLVRCVSFYCVVWASTAWCVLLLLCMGLLVFLNATNIDSQTRVPFEVHQMAHGKVPVEPNAWGLPNSLQLHFWCYQCADGALAMRWLFVVASDVLASCGFCVGDALAICWLPVGRLLAMILLCVGDVLAALAMGSTPLCF